MQQDEHLLPTGIEVSNQDQIIEITWDDLGMKAFPLWGLRKNCPCVVCRGGHEHMSEFEPEAFKAVNPPRIDIKDLKVIGNHAIQIVWSDRHDSGMYRWETLKELSKHL